MKRALTMLVLLMVASLAFVCDQSYAPVIRNTLDEPVQLEITYSNGTSFSGDYPPGATIYAPAEGLDLERVEVRAGSRPPIELSKVELARLRAEVGPEDRVIWNISEDGIRPAELSE